MNQRTTNNRIMTTTIIVLTGLGLWGTMPTGRAQRVIPSPALQAPRRLDSDERSTVQLFRQAAPSVVNICTKTAVAQRSGEVALNMELIPEGSGSGFVWDGQGHVVTNYHVVRDGDAAQVTLSDGSIWDAELAGAAPEYDVAVLRIKAPANQLTPLAIGHSNDLDVGQKVFAIGDPFGLDHTLTTGIISGLGRQIESMAGQAIEDVIQTDAAINPGNSGGPLLDSQGQLIGMNTAIFSPSGVSAGVGFAVPVDTISAVVPDLIRTGKVERPGLGVTIAPPDVAERAGVEGVLILRVTEGSPAAEAGLQPTQFDAEGNLRLGDTIMSINGERVLESNDLLQRLRNHQVGDVVTLGIKRGEEFAHVPVKLRAI
jgi:S1-C subfamily serine protease